MSCGFARGESTLATYSWMHRSSVSSCALRNLARPCHLVWVLFLTVDSIATHPRLSDHGPGSTHMVHAFTTSTLDYCNSMLVRAASQEAARNAERRCAVDQWTRKLYRITSRFYAVCNGYLFVTGSFTSSSWWSLPMFWRWGTSVSSVFYRPVTGITWRGHQWSAASGRLQCSTDSHVRPC